MPIGLPPFLLATPLLGAARASSRRETDASGLTLYLCGDVMTGRGIDQILPHPNDPVLYESLVKNAVRYVELAEAASGPIQRPVDLAYIWGDALDELERVGPDARIINLETAVTSSPDAWEGKGIHYRMHPDNVGCLTAARIDCCALANNHTLDWGRRGLAETLQALHNAKILAAGAGRDRREAEAPAIIDVAGKGRVVVLSFGFVTSGIPAAWAALDHRPGLDVLQRLDEPTIKRIAAQVDRVKTGRDIVIASIHWGENWGYEIPPDHRRFARGLIDEAGVDVVHGHSSHHPLGIEVYRDKLILYGCGDFISDYEGIGGREEYRGELALMYFITVDPADGRLMTLRMTPMRMKQLRSVLASPEETAFLVRMLNREGRTLGTCVKQEQDGRLTLQRVRRGS